MVTTAQVRQGAMRYIQTDMLPKLSGVKKTGLAVAAELYAMQMDKIIHDFMDRPAIRYMNLQDAAGNIDLERVHDVLRKHMQQEDRIDIPIPVIGPYTIDKTDVERLIQYIKEAQ